MFWFAIFDELVAATHIALVSLDRRLHYASDAAYAGGIAGYGEKGTISNTAALGGKVTAASDYFNDTTRQAFAGRIAGFADSTGYAPFSLSRNYANDGIQTGTGSYNASNTNFLTDNVAAIMALITGSVPGSKGLTTINGADANVDDLRNASFWLRYANDGLSFNYSPEQGIHNTWDFAGIEGRGYPLLLLPDGTRMAGQE